MNDAPDVEELPEPADWSEMFESRFLHAPDLKGQTITLTIEAVKVDKVPDEKSKDPNAKKKMGCLFFEGKKKPLGLNRTNARCMKEMFGSRCAEWKGKRVTIYPTTTRMPIPGVKGKTEEVPCIRIMGSPDIDRDLTFTLVLPFKSPQQITLKKMQQKQAPQEAAK